MKRKFLLLSVYELFLVSLIFSFGPTVEVISPNFGDVWFKGQTYTISWKSAGINSQMKMTLYKPDKITLTMIIKKPVASSGILKWKVPLWIPQGEYIVRVKTLDNKYFAESQVFKIADPNFFIKVIEPKESDRWYKNYTKTIRWIKNGKMDGQVKITLYKPDLKTLVYIIKKPTLNNNSYKWTIPSNVPVGQYIIRVKTMDNKVFGNSKSFFILEPQKNKVNYFDVIQPLPLELKKEKLKVFLPDLVVSVLKAQQNTLSLYYTVLFEVKNIGEAESLPCKLKTFVTNEGDKIFIVRSLKPGERVIFKRKVYTLRKPVKIYGIVDFLNTVKEKNEKNNKGVL